MANILTLIILSAIGYWMVIIISRKKRELADKELLQREQFLKETQSLLKMETPIAVDVATQPATQYPTSNTDFIQKVSDYFSAQGYSITQLPKAEGIDLIGVKEKELLLIRSDNVIKEVTKNYPNLNTWVRDKKSKETFLDKFDDKIQANIDLETVYTDYVNKYKRNV